MDSDKITIDFVENPHKSPWRHLEYFINAINQFLIGFVTIYLSWWCLSQGLKGITLHAWLCTIGFSFLMAEGLMTHYNGNTFLLSYKRKSRTTIHWILQALGGAIGIAGGVIEMCRMDVHFVTIHGKLGFSAIILCAVSMISGLSALFPRWLRKIISPLLNKTVHNVLGVGTFAIALVAQYYGYQSWSFELSVQPDFRYTMEVITLTSLVLTCLGPLISLWYRIMNCME
ncbi:transmembrane reductase CYB561D2-like [Episyrphus balteatus]|uniref:transmembrane reductase CYB561D2-like n=1 Tax=Episyrphus balteatus TaxID=286459 RepID=UPI002485324F|nr:transmembrane reductase CYB561D2-like [Episyrphus balteatus]